MSETDQFLSTAKPWEKTGQERSELITQAAHKVVQCAFHLQPFMPQTAAQILKHFSAEKILAHPPLFPRLP